MASQSPKQTTASLEPRPPYGSLHSTLVLGVGKKNENRKTVLWRVGSQV